MPRRKLNPFCFSSMAEQKAPTRMIWFEALAQSYNPATGVWAADPGPHPAPDRVNPDALPRTRTPPDNYTVTQDPATGDLYYSAWDVHEEDEGPLNEYLMRRRGEASEPFVLMPISLREHQIVIHGDTLYI